MSSQSLKARLAEDWSTMSSLRRCVESPNYDEPVQTLTSAWNAMQKPSQSGHSLRQISALITLSQDAGDQSLAWWKEMKVETKLICVKKRIDVLKSVAGRSS